MRLTDAFVNIEAMQVFDISPEIMYININNRLYEGLYSIFLDINGTLKSDCSIPNEPLYDQNLSVKTLVNRIFRRLTE